MKLSLTILFSFVTASAVAEEISLRPPLQCGPSTATPCIIQQYVDTDPGIDASDFMCGTLSYNGHKGTDFRLPTLADMARETVVVASAAGQIKAVRDGMMDIPARAPNAPNVSGRECGNGVVIDHGDGWETQYCHLKNGSVTVSEGDTVVAGDRLGSVGLSGLTEFPHVHLSLRKDGKVVDPFNPDAAQSCGEAERDLWADNIAPAYRAGGILDVGFYDRVPKFTQIKQGDFDPETLTSNAPALVAWVYLFGGRKGDLIRFEINGPDGWSFSSEDTLEKTQAQLFRASGQRRPQDGWAVGQYEGTISLIRNDEVLEAETVALTISQ